MTWFTASHAPPEPHLPPDWRVMPFDTLDSTNAALRRIAEQGEGGEVAEGLIVWAATQTGGRGRSGRTWVSPRGNLYASILIAAPNTARAPELGFVAALAVRDTVLELPRHNAAPPGVTCKWPNDILLDGKKVSGVLPELITDPDKRQWAVLGIGINLIPVEVEAANYPVAALSDYHIDTTPAHVLTVLSRTLAQGLERWRSEGFEAVRAAWLACGPQVGTPVSVRLADGIVAGSFGGLDAHGALLLDTPQGRRSIVAGDVLFEGGS